MPRPETSHRPFRFLYFPPVGYGPYGNALRGTPVQMNARIEGSNVEMMGPNGTPMIVDKMLSVAVDVQLQGQVWEGEEEEWYGSGSAHLEGDLYEVVAFNSVPDVKGRISQRTVGLRRYSNTPPR